MASQINSSQEEGVRAGNRVSQLEHLENFKLVRYNPSEILLVENSSGTVFQFFRADPKILKHSLRPEVAIEGVLRGVLWRDGVMYCKGESLDSLLDWKRREKNPLYFTEQELLNTFAPLFESLSQIHNLGIVYNKITHRHVQVVGGEIKLIDWLLPELHPHPHPSPNSNLQDLAALLSESCVLVKGGEEGTGHLAAAMLARYSRDFVLAVVALLEGLGSEYFVQLSQGDKTKLETLNQHPTISLLMSEASEIVALRQKEQLKVVENVDKNEQKSLKIKLLQSVENEKVGNGNKEGKAAPVPLLSSPSPTKKFHITTPSRRPQDAENKKVLNEEVKKKQIEKITRIIERSNAFVNELMARKNCDKKLVAKGVSIYDSYAQENNTMRKIGLFKDSPKIGSPSKRLRSISKKK